MPDARARVTVLYSHSLLGEGLARLLAEEPGLEVEAIELSDVERVQAAIASRPEVIVVEEGGRLDGIDVLRQGGSPVVVDVDIRSMEAWAFHRDPIASRAESLLEAIREAVGLPSPGPASDGAEGTAGADDAPSDGLDGGPHHEGPAHLRHTPAAHVAAEGPAPA